MNSQSNNPGDPDRDSYCSGANALGSELSCFDLPVRWFESTGSTNDEAKRFASNNPLSKALLFAAAHQTRGRGQREKKWSAPRDSCVLTSVAVPPEWVAWNPLLFKWAGAWTVCETASHFGLSNVTIKRPNDVLVNGKKISGVLLETSYRKESLLSCVLGVGINVLPTRFPDSSDFPVTPTSFALENVSVSLPELYRVWTMKMNALLTDFQNRDSFLAKKIEPWVREQDRESFWQEVLAIRDDKKMATAP